MPDFVVGDVPVHGGHLEGVLDVDGLVAGTTEFSWKVDNLLLRQSLQTRT